MRRTQLITTAALVAACAVPAAAAGQPYEYMYSSDPNSAAERAQAPQDLRSPDARDAASASETPRYSDLRSPDARDAGRTPDTSVAQDLRSPDARDAGRPQTPPADNVVEIREVPNGGFDWGDAGIGAAGILALLSIAAGLTLVITGRRRRGGSEMPAH